VIVRVGARGVGFFGRTGAALFIGVGETDHLHVAAMGETDVHAVAVVAVAGVADDDGAKFGRRGVGGGCEGGRGRGEARGVDEVTAVHGRGLFNGVGR